MKTILTALALVLSATAANATTYTFDLYQQSGTTGPFGPPSAPVLVGSGTFSLTDEQTTATAKTNQAGFSVYEPASFDLKLDFTNYNWTDSELTIGRVNVGHQLVTYQCVMTPTGCTAGNPTVSNSLRVDFVGGTFVVGSPDVLSDGNLSQSNVGLVFSHATSGSMTLNSTSPYGVQSGPVSLQLSNIRAVAAPVPEPGEWAMMAGGLALVGGIARRRRL